MDGAGIGDGGQRGQSRSISGDSAVCRSVKEQPAFAMAEEFASFVKRMGDPDRSLRSAVLSRLKQALRCSS